LLLHEFKPYQEQVVVFMSRKLHTHNHCLLQFGIRNILRSYSFRHNQTKTNLYKQKYPSVIPFTLSVSKKRLCFTKCVYTRVYDVCYHVECLCWPVMTCCLVSSTDVLLYLVLYRGHPFLCACVYINLTENNQ
jgi:hypothetical protein